MGLKVYIAVDLEGISGVYYWAQADKRNPTHPAFQEARALMMGDIEAVIEGCIAAGATEIIVRDGHGGGKNLIPERMHPKATYIGGAARGMAALPELDASVAAMILLGYHAMMGTADGVLHHTQSHAARRRYFYNGQECGELVQHALRAGHFGVPVVLLSGDAATCREARRFLGESVITVCTKIGYAEECARLFPPAIVRAQLRQAAEKAVCGRTSVHPYAISLPIAGRLLFPDKALADAYPPKSPLTRRADEVSYEHIFETAEDVAEF